MSNSSPGAEGETSWRNTFRALRYRNYRLFFVGQGLSLIGTWIQAVALSWLVYKITGSALFLGVVGFASQIATFALSPFAGVMVDRWNQHRILLVTQSLFMLQAFIMAALVLTGIIQVWQIIILSIFLGLVNGFDTPTRQAFVVQMIDDRTDLGNAIALNSSMFNGARLVGPAIAGVLIGAVGEGICFLLNGASYIAVIFALLAMRISHQIPEEAVPSAVRQLREGVSYTFGFPPVREIILMLAIISFVSTPYAILLPVFATQILHGSANTYGFLSAAAGVGALIGAFFLASRKSVLGLGKWIYIASIIMGGALIGFAFSNVLWLSLLLLVFIGFAIITQMASSNTILQTIAPDEVRGRVMSFYTMAFLGMTPFGSLAGGAIAARIGAPLAVAIGGGIAIISAAIFALRLPQLRVIIHPIYCELGIVPAVLCGVQACSESMVPPE